MQLLFLVFIVLINKVFNVTVGENFILNKCCDIKSEMIKGKNNKFICGGYRDNSHYQILKTYNTDSKYNNSDNNSCLEIYDKKLTAFVFVNSGAGERKNESDLEFYPKCCPMDFVYDSTYHSCTPLESYMEWNESLSSVSVGLSHCKIIKDYQFLSAATAISYSLLLPKQHHSDDLLPNQCLDKDNQNNFVLRVCANNFDICRWTRCIHKCCADNQSFVNGSRCQNTYVYGISLNFSNYIDDPLGDFAIIHGYNGSLYLQPADWEYSLDSKGIFHYFDEKIGSEIYYPRDETYCIEHATKNGKNYGFRLFRKHPDAVEEIETKYYLNGWAMVVSSVFLVLTIMYYIFTSEAKNLFGKTLVSFCVSLLSTFVLLIFSTFDLVEIKAEKNLCYTIGFLLIYMEFSSFLWLKLLCYDIYCTFGSGKVVAVDKRKKRKLKKFIFYSIYGWGLSLFLTAIPLTFFYVDVLPPQLQIQMGIYRCFIDRGDGNYADLVFHTIPISIVESINILLFIKTVTYCIQVKNEIRKVNDTNRTKDKSRFLANKERLGLILKLFIIMGISYLFEVVSSFYDFNNNKITKHIEMVWDVLNCLQGLFIFIIFICKKKHIKKIKNSAGVQKLRKISFSSASTNTTNLLSVKQDEKRRRKSQE